jgi:hypothetical protein
LIRKKKRYYYSSSQGVTYSTELQAVIDAATLAMETVPDATRLSALDAFILARIADGSWTVLKSLRIQALNNVGLSAFSTYNYKDPSAHRMTLANSPVYGLGGWSGDSVSAYGDSNLNLNTQGGTYTLNSASRGMWVYTAPSMGTALDGVSTGAFNRMLSQSSVGQRINQGTNSLNAAIDFSGTGYRAIDRPGSGVVNGFVGLVKNARTGTSTAIESTNQLLFRSSSAYSDAQIAMYYTGGSLTDTQHNNIANDFQTYLTAIGL